MKGRQTNEIVDDYEMDVDLTIYSNPWWKRSSAIGYTYPNTVRTWINRKFFSAFTLAEIAGNISHEYCHKIGFDHSFFWTPTREKSVPYAIGNIISDLVKNME